MGEHVTTLRAGPGPDVPGIPDHHVRTPGPQDDPGPTRILLIESDESNAQLIREVLDEDGNYEVRSVTSAMEALQALGLSPDGEALEPGWPANLILFDLTLLNDQERRALRRSLDEGRKWPPMIMLSGWPAPYVESILARVNTAGVIAKPFDVQTLLDSVHQVLRTQRYAREGY